jgi:transcriptional regulator with XRE-family HTH domain
MDTNRRDELAAFLRARRARLSPRQAGLPAAGGPGRRRTPGLRRQEVAQLAGLSVDYYIRLEQARGPHPSRQVLAALARDLTPGIRHLLDSMPGVPAYVVDAAYNVLAWNQLATHFIGDLSGYEDRNMIRWTFLLAPQDVIWSDADFVRFTRSTVADLRASYACYPGDPGIDGLVTEMLALSPRFAQMWAEHEVEVRGPMLKHVLHPLAGPLEFECQVLHIAETGQRLIAYCAAPGSATEAAFAELAARTPLPA